MACRESRAKDVQDSLRTLLNKQCQMGKKNGEGVCGDAPGAANGCCTVGVTAKQLQETDAPGCAPKNISFIVIWALHRHRQLSEGRGCSPQEPATVSSHPALSLGMPAMEGH